MSTDKLLNQHYINNKTTNNYKFFCIIIISYSIALQYEMCVYIWSKLVFSSGAFK